MRTSTEAPAAPVSASTLRCLRAIEQKVLWLAVWMAPLYALVSQFVEPGPHRPSLQRMPVQQGLQPEEGQDASLDVLGELPGQHEHRLVGFQKERQQQQAEHHAYDDESHLVHRIRHDVSQEDRQRDADAVNQQGAYY